MAKNKSMKVRRLRESSTFRWFFGNVFSLIRRHGNAIAMWLAIAYSVHETALTFVAYAGRTSVADLTFKMLANISMVWTLSLTLSGLSITLYIREARLHRKTRDRLTDRITELELKIDPKRTSSMLTPEGLTRKEDE